MQPYLALDPRLFACPSLVASEEDLLAAMAELVRLSDAVRNWSDGKFFVDQQLFEYLAADGLYPLVDSLCKMLAQLHIEHVYNGKQIFSSLRTLWDRAISLDEISSVIELDIVSLNVEPGIGGGDKLSEACRLTLAHCGIALAYRGDQSCAMLTLPGSPQQHSVELDAFGILTSGELEELKFSLSVKTPSKFSDFVESLDPYELWSKAEDDGEFKFAILMNAARFRREAGCLNPEANCAAVSIGKKFKETLSKWQANGNSKYSSTTFETCSRLAAKMPKDDCNGFGKVRTVDQAVSYRTHISKEHEALRLMYWELQNGAIELACVGSKFELEIPE